MNLLSEQNFKSDRIANREIGLNFLDPFDGKRSSCVRTIWQLAESSEKCHNQC